jgi:hypothetical protein
MKRIVFACVAAALLATGSLRAAAAAGPEPITHEAAEKKSTVTVRLAGTLKIVLPTRSEAGFQWQIIANDPRIIKPNGDVKPAASGKTADGAAPWEVTFVAQRPGRSVVRFIWAKAGASEVASPDDVREVTVRVQ